LLNDCSRAADVVQKEVVGFLNSRLNTKQTPLGRGIKEPTKKSEFKKKKNGKLTGRWWLTSIILADWEAEIGRIEIQVQPRKIA
jgi:hypothetical protein